MINTKCQVVGIEGSTTSNWSGVPPLEASPNSGAIIDRFDQVIVDTDGLTHVRVKIVTLHDVLNIAADIVSCDNRVHVSILGHSEGLTAIASFVQAATDSCVSYIKAVSQTQRNTTKECVAIVLESAVVTLNVSTVKCYVIAMVQSEQNTCVREWLTVVHGVSVAVEEVASRLNHFVTDDGVEVTNLHGQVAVTSFQVQLWQCRPILAAIGPTFLEVVSTLWVTEGLSVGSVGTVDIVNSSTDVETAGGVDRFLSEQPALLQLHFVGVLIEVDGWIREVTQLHPTTSSDSVALSEEGVRVAQAAVATVKAASDSATAEAEPTTS